LGCACAAVISDLPAMRDIVTNGLTGMVVPQKNPGALAKKVIELLDHPERARKLALAGRQFVLERFDWNQIARRYQELIETTIRDHVRP
jgi:glycosyltransferase involved in cell wall biosynthesis